MRNANGSNAGLRHELDVANTNIDRLRAVPADARKTYVGIANRGQPRQEDDARIKELCDRIVEQNREIASLENRLEQAGQRARNHTIQGLPMQLDGENKDILRLTTRNEEVYRHRGRTKYNDAEEEAVGEEKEDEEEEDKSTSKLHPSPISEPPAHLDVETEQVRQHS